MGLDMYLNKKRYLSKFSEEDKKIKDAIVAVVGHDVTEITSDGMYWRKANHIHNWFVNNIQDGKDDCGTYYVSRECLEELADLCEEVMNNPELGAEKLPTVTGFFFGDASYDDYYLDECKRTASCIRQLLKDTSDQYTFEYHSSW
jgi:hypothetical protein